MQRTEDLLCDEHHRQLGKGELQVITGLKSDQLKSLLALKSTAANDQPQESRHAPAKPGDEAPGKRQRVKEAVFSAPGLLVLSAPPIMALLDLTWRNSLNIELPFGEAGPGAEAYLSAQFAILLLGLGLIYFALILAFFVVAWILRLLKIALSVDSFRLGIARLRLNLSKTAHRRTQEIARNVALSGRDAATVKRHLDEISRRHRKAESELEATIVGLRNALRRKLKELVADTKVFFSDFWEVFVSGGKLGKFEMVSRTIAIAIMAGALILVPLVVSGNMKAEMAVLSPRGSDEPECTDVTFPFAAFSVARFPCGRVLVSSFYDVPGTKFWDASLPGLPDDVRVSEEMFHLGTYGKWSVFAPVSNTEERVKISSALIQQFPVAVQPGWTNEPNSGPTLAAQVIAATARLGTGVEHLAKVLEHGTRKDVVALKAKVAELSDRVEKIGRGLPENFSVPVNLAITLNQPGPDFRNVHYPSFQLLTASHAMTDAANTLGALNRKLSGVLEDLPTKIPEAPKPKYISQLSARFGSQAVNTCLNSLDRNFQFVEFSEGSSQIGTGAIAGSAEKIMNVGLRASKTGAHQVVILKGFASTSGLTERNARLADERADAVKIALLIEMFKGTRKSALANGHQDLQDINTTIIAHAIGEAIDSFDGASGASSRRVTIESCVLQPESDAGALALKQE